MKTEFINQLKDSHVDAIANEWTYQGLPEDSFVPFDETMVGALKDQHAWSDKYFNEKVENLRFGFSKKLIEHIIEVKKYLQNSKDYPDFIFANQNSQTNEEVSDCVAKSNITNKQSQQNPSFDTDGIDLAGFQPSENLKNVLSENDLANIRSYILSILTDRRISSEDFLKNIAYISQKQPSLFDTEEESAFTQEIKKNPTDWDIDYFNLQQMYLNRNFSLERLFHLANMREAFVKPVANKVVKTTTVSSPVIIEDKPQPSGTRSQPSTSNNSYTNSSQYEELKKSRNPFVRAALLVGGVALAFVGFFYFAFRK